MRTAIVYTAGDATRPPGADNRVLVHVCNDEGGWGKGFMNITPSGKVLPCHAAESIKFLSFDNVKDRPLRDIWLNSDAFNAFRGTAWMKEPCASCEERDKDLGGCRCQAYLLAQDPAAADPVCSKSPRHHVVVDAVERAQQSRAPERPLIFRRPENSRLLAEQEGR